MANTPDPTVGLTGSDTNIVVTIDLPPQPPGGTSYSVIKDGNAGSPAATGVTAATWGETVTADGSLHSYALLSNAPGATPSTPLYVRYEAESNPFYLAVDPLDSAARIASVAAQDAARATAGQLAVVVVQKDAPANHP